ncbi:MAG: DUF6856 family protein [Mycoplasmoidaceae bacterium]
MKKLFQKNKFKLLSLSLIGIAATASIFLSSCGAYQPIRFRVIKDVSSSSNQILLDSLKTSNADPKSAILGDKSINSGNYIIIYGSIAGSSSTLGFREWLTGGSISNGGGVTINPVINANFLNAFLGNQELKDKVEVMLYIDNPGFSNQDNIYSKLNFDPYEKYTDKILLEEYNYQYKLDNGLPQSAADQIVEFDKLPWSYKDKNNQFIRQDDSAKSYRDFVDYATSIRPNLSPISGDNNKLSGGIAFSGKNAPSLLGTLSPADGSSIDTNQTVKALYKYYLEKDYIQ